MVSRQLFQVEQTAETLQAADLVADGALGERR